MTNQRRLMAYLFVACLPLLVASCCSTVPSTIIQAPVVKPKSASQAALHVIGVYQGQLPETADKRPWWAQCQAMNEAAVKSEPSIMNTCQALLNPGRDQRTITVNVSDETTPIILGLMAYEGVTWQINTTPGVVIEKVILAGYHQQRIQGVGDAQVDVYSYDNSPCDRCVQKGRYFYSYERVPFEMEVAAGVRASSFQGNYTGGTYQIFKGMQ
ncbi:hypothetical protein [Methylophilus sp. OH31]|uniref:hypothetical protein n=1 Tax=Methylophilus sp. OH31 TaxID=1387312 RepID=UPI001F591C11|nr:hypothetical protein [Methylophilus sp. OH31]